MALSAKDQRERDWLAFYCLAEQYRREHGDLLVPNDYVCQGKRLGAWIGTQRMEYKSRTNPRFTQARVDLLNAIVHRGKIKLRMVLQRLKMVFHTGENGKKIQEEQTLKVAFVWQTIC